MRSAKSMGVPPCRQFVSLYFLVEISRIRTTARAPDFNASGGARNPVRMSARGRFRSFADTRANGEVAPKAVTIGRLWSERAKPTQTGPAPREVPPFVDPNLASALQEPCLCVTRDSGKV